MAMTLRLPADLDAEIRAVAAEEHRSVHQAVVHAVEVYLSMRETAEIKADADTLRSLAAAREAVRAGDVVHGTEAIEALIRGRTAS